jgi:hypothetical protein
MEGPFPKISHRDLEERDLAELGAYVTVLVNAGVELDEKTERYLKRVGGLPVAEGER